jgi:hypothetical protein
MRQWASREDAMEQILVAAICLLTAMAASLSTRHRARSVAFRSKQRRGDQVARP